MVRRASWCLRRECRRRSSCTGRRRSPGRTTYPGPRPIPLGLGLNVPGACWMTSAKSATGAMKFVNHRAADFCLWRKWHRAYCPAAPYRPPAAPWLPDRDRLRNGIHVQREGQVLRSSRTHRHAQPRVSREAGRSGFDRISSRGQSADGEMTFAVRRRAADHRAALIFCGDFGGFDGFACLIDDGSSECAGGGLCANRHDSGCADQRHRDSGTKRAA